MLLCALLLFGSILTTSAFAGSVTVSTENSEYYILTYSSSGQWVGIGTPKHTINETGQVAYCVQTNKDSPYNSGYSQINWWDVYDETTMIGIRSILEYGYPAGDGGFPADQARYATANALRFWLAERGADSVPSWMNQQQYSYLFKARPGYEDLYNWCMTLLQLARNQSLVPHSVTFSQPTITLTQRGDNFIGTVSVETYNCCNGYKLNGDALPKGSDVKGYTGSSGDVLEIIIPIAYEEQNYNLLAIGRDIRSNASLVFFAPDNSGQQRVATYSLDPNGEAVTTSLTISTPKAEAQTASVCIRKIDSDTRQPMPNVHFNLYDAYGNTVGYTGTDDSGCAYFNNLALGVYYYSEAEVPEGYAYDGEWRQMELTEPRRYDFTMENTRSKGTLCLVKQDAYTKQPLAGAGFKLYDSNGLNLFQGHTEENGELRFPNIYCGTYSYKEYDAPEGYVLDDTMHTVNITENGETVTEYIENTRCAASISVIKKYADGSPLEGACFTLESSTDNGANWTAVSEQLTDRNGYAIWDGLYATPGTRYRLTEKSSVPGQSLQADIIFEGSLPIDGMYDLSFTVYNSAISTLPFTGGNGFNFIPVSVLMLCMGFFIIKIVIKRKETL